jgi:hypothetical protein
MRVLPFMIRLSGLTWSDSICPGAKDARIVAVDWRRQYASAQRLAPLSSVWSA